MVEDIEPTKYLRVSSPYNLYSIIHVHGIARLACGNWTRSLFGGGCSSVKEILG